MKEELFRKAKQHYNYVEETIKENKKKRKKTRGHLIHNKYESVGLGSVTTTSYSVGFAAILLFIAKLPLGLAIAAGCLGGFVCSFVIPRIIHFSILKGAKGKLGRGYAKLEVDNHFKVMKWFYKKYYKDIVKAKSSDDVSLSDLQSFAKQISIFAYNGKHNLDDNICKKVTKRNKKDLDKIANLTRTMGNRRVLEKKVQKIIEKNNKFTKPWCEVYNECASQFRDLYLQAHDMDSSIRVPENYEFGLNYQALQNMVANHVDKSLVTTQKQINTRTLEDNGKTIDNSSYNSNYKFRTKNRDDDYEMH